MKINATNLLINEEQATGLCRTENNGLVGKLADFFRGGPPAIEIIDVKQLYFPYYCTTVQLQLPKSRRVQQSAMEASLVVDGVFGTVRGMEGTPQTEQIEVARSSVAKTRCSKEQAAEHVREFVRKYMYRKFHVFPSFDSISSTVVYKPLYAVQCKKRKKQYYQIVDAEMGCKDYTINFRYSEVQFHKG